MIEHCNNELGEVIVTRMSASSGVRHMSHVVCRAAASRAGDFWRAGPTPRR